MGHAEDRPPAAPSPSSPGPAPPSSRRGAEAFARLSQTFGGEVPQAGSAAMQLLPLPLRVGAIGAFALVALGLLWATVARVPEQVEGLAVIVPPDGIEVARAQSSGTLLYQLEARDGSALSPAAQRLNRQIAAYWADPELILATLDDQAGLEALIRQLVRPLSGQPLRIADQEQAPGAFVPGGAVIGAIDNEQEREALRNTMEHRLADLRIQQGQLRRGQSRIAELRRRQQLQNQQLRLDAAVIDHRQQLTRVLKELQARGGIARIQVQRELELLAQLQSQALANQQERIGSDSRLGDELEAVAVGKDRRRQQLDALESAMIRYLDRTVLFSPPGGAYLLRALHSNGDSVSRGEALYQYTQEPPALPREVPLLLGSNAAPRVFAGMEVSLTPYGMVRSQVGGIRGRVQQIGAVPVTAAKVMAVTGLDSASHPLLRSLPTAYLAIVRLETAPGGACNRLMSRNCYRWSGNQAPPEPVRLGTLAEVRVTTRYRHPIEFVMPALRRLLGGPG